MNSGESGFKIIVILMILSLGYLGREYLGLRVEMENLNQSYSSCVDANRTMQSQSNGQAARLQELETRALQWEPALHALQAENENLIREQEDILANLLQVQALNAQLTSQLEQAQSSSGAEQKVSRQEKPVSMDIEAEQEHPAIYLPGVGNLNLSGIGWQAVLGLILVGAALGGFGVGRLTIGRIWPDRQVNIRLTRAEVHLIARLRRQKEVV